MVFSKMVYESSNDSRIGKVDKERWSNQKIENRSNGTISKPCGISSLCSLRTCLTEAIYESWITTEALFSNRLSGLLLCGPIALIGGKDGMNIFGESTCFALAGLALIPCAERLSFVTEEIAAHTNETFGALLIATFGNAPELLISTAALRFGFYRVVQLTSLGSILTNLLLVFGISSFIGGLRWQVQEVRLTSGNVSVGMLLIATSGLILPAALKLSNEEMFTNKEHADASLMFSRFNALLMIFMYLGYLIFQLVTHKEEFEDNPVLPYDSLMMAEGEHHHHGSILPSGQFYAQKREMKNVWCNKYVDSNALPLHNGNSCPITPVKDLDSEIEMTLPTQSKETNQDGTESSCSESEENSQDSDIEELFLMSDTQTSISLSESSKSHSLHQGRRRSQIGRTSTKSGLMDDREEEEKIPEKSVDLKRSKSDGNLSDDIGSANSSSMHTNGAKISLRAGIIWLLIITMGISSMSHIIVDTIDGFAQKSHISEVFTSVVIIPFFSNIAEQVSAVIFAYRNKMDLCVGITAGSAIQISLCVLPGSVLIGWVMDRSMSLFFNGFETCCLVMAVLSVSVILQGGTTNWLAGLFFISIYLMIAAGFWFHSIEDLSTDEELLFDLNTTKMVIGSHSNAIISNQAIDIHHIGDGH